MRRSNKVLPISVAVVAIVAVAARAAALEIVVSEPPARRHGRIPRQHRRGRPQEIRDLFPFKLNFVEIRDGFVTFVAPGVSTENSMTIHEFDLRLHNLTNFQETDELASADIELNGWIMGDTPLVISGAIDPN